MLVGARSSSARRSRRRSRATTWAPRRCSTRRRRPTRASTGGASSASRWAAAEWRRRAGDPSALAELEALEAPLARDGFGPLLVRVHRSLRLLGERRAVRAPAAGAARLTAREQEIATLVARGLTNQEIARRMGLGRPTVARLLSNGMAKLGVDSRAQVAARVGDLV